VVILEKPNGFAVKTAKIPRSMTSHSQEGIYDTGRNYQTTLTLRGSEPDLPDSDGGKEKENTLPRRPAI